MATEIPLTRKQGSGAGAGGHNGNGNGNGHSNGNGNGGYTTGLNINEQIRDVLHVLFKRRRLIATLFLVVALPGLLITVLKRPSYIATAKVLITTERADVTVQPSDITKLTQVTLNESIVNSEVHIIRSRE